MQFTTTLAALLAAATATMAAPTPIANPEGTSDVSARAATWTLENFSRRCGGGSCTFSYSKERPEQKIKRIDADMSSTTAINDGASTTDCYYKSAGKHASYSTTCGPYAITSAWDGEPSPFSTPCATGLHC